MTNNKRYLFIVVAYLLVHRVESFLYVRNVAQCLGFERIRSSMPTMIHRNFNRRDIPITLDNFDTGTNPNSLMVLSMWSRNDDLEGSDRFKACVPYLLPLLDGDGFGRYIYDRIPPLNFLDSLFIGPLYENYEKIPLLGLLLFLALTIGTRGNTDMSRVVRFNAQQAAMIDAALVIPALIGYAFEDDDMPRYIVEPCNTFVWYTYMAMVLYSIYSNLRGRKPDQIPLISDLAELLAGPL